MISTPAIDVMTVVEMANVAIDTAPTYTATKQAKKRAKNPLAAASDIRTETMMVLAVPTSRNDMRIRRPVSAVSVIVPTCHISTDEMMTINSLYNLQYSLKRVIYQGQYVRATNRWNPQTLTLSKGHTNLALIGFART
jgi:hypothetical protein